MDASRVAEEKYIYLTTRGRKTGNPHTVELWFAITGKKIYLSHEGAYTDWIKNILEDSRVEFRIGKVQFEGNARIAEGGEVSARAGEISRTNLPFFYSLHFHFLSNSDFVCIRYVELGLFISN